MTTHMTTAKKAAPVIKPLPDDVLALLSRQHEAMSQTDMAEALGISTSAVNQAIHNKFQGNVDRFVSRVRGLWGGSTVSCPVLGVISTKVCQDQQQKGAAFTNPLRVAVARACKTCPHRNSHVSTQTGGPNHEA